MSSQRINRSALERLVKSPPSGTKKLIWDRDVVGFGAYMTSRGSISFLYQYRFRGSATKSIKIGNHGELTCEQARQIAARYALQKLNGIDPIATIKAEKVSKQASVDLVIANYFEAYAERRRIKDPVSDRQMAVFRRDLLAHIGHLRLDQLTTDQVDQFEKELAARGPSMIRSGLVCLGTVINDAVKRGKIARHEAHNFDVPSINKRDRLIEEWEFLRMFEAVRDIDDVRADVFEVLLRTAKRKEEIADLPWEELDLPKEIWNLPAERNKSGKNHVIMLPRQVLEIIKRQQPDPAKRKGPVFTLNGTTPPEMGSSVKDMLDANLHRRVELATPAGETPRRINHYTLHDWRKVVTTTLRKRPYPHIISQGLRQNHRWPVAVSNRKSDAPVIGVVEHFVFGGAGYVDAAGQITETARRAILKRLGADARTSRARYCIVWSASECTWLEPDGQRREGKTPPLGEIGDPWASASQPAEVEWCWTIELPKGSNSPTLRRR